MKAAAIVAVALVAVSASNGFSQDRRAELLQQHAGKTLWLDQYAPIKLCPTPTISCSESHRGPFKIVDVVIPPSTGGYYYQVQTSDGRTLYARAITAEHFVTHDPAKKRAADAVECKRRGAPKIGMTREQAVATCWGKPDTINRTVTAKAVREQFVYEGRGAYLYFTNGILDAFQD